jgi:cytochrome c551/c552
LGATANECRLSITGRPFRYTDPNGDRAHIIDTIKNGSIIIWQHINMQRGYNFSDDYLKDALDFGIEDLLALQIG